MSVDSKIHDDLLDLTGIRPDQASLRTQFSAELDDVLAQQPAQHAVHVCDQRIEVDDFRRDKLTAAECQQLTSEPRSPIGSFLDLTHFLPHPLVRLETRE